MAVVFASRYTRYPATPVPASVEAVQLRPICVVDCAVAARPCGTEGGVVSAGGGGGDAGGDSWRGAHARDLRGWIPGLLAAQHSHLAVPSCQGSATSI